MFGLGQSYPGAGNVAVVVLVGLVAAAVAIALLLIAGMVLARRRRSPVNRFIPMGRLSPMLGGLALLVATLVLAPPLGRMVGVEVPVVSFAWLGL